MAVTLYIYVVLLFLCIGFSANTIVINPGDNVQSAIDSMHQNPSGGTVIFNKGTYIITTSIIVYSNITLQGNTSLTPADIIITIDPNNLKYDKDLITVPSTKGLIENIKLINFHLLGNIQPSEQKFPACCHSDPTNCSSNPPCSQARSGQNGFQTGGGGTSIDTAQFRNLVLKDLIVSKLAMGLAFSGWKNVLMENIEAYGNGMIQTYFHNIYLRRNFNITIRNIKSHDSPTGNGINISQSDYIYAFLSLFENNYWRGFRIEGEGGFICQHFLVSNNTCNNNKDAGFRFADDDDGVVEYNSAKDNKENCYKGGLTNVTFIDNDGF